MKNLLLLLALGIITVAKAGLSFTYSNGADLNIQRHLHQSQKLNDGRIIVFGGHNGYAISPTYYNSSEIYDPVLNTWIEGPSMKAFRYNHTSTLLGDGRILTMGGQLWGSSAEIFDPITNQWSYVATPDNVGAIKMLTLKDGRGFIVGLDSDGNTKCAFFIPSLEKWIDGPALYKQHGGGFTLTLLSSGKVLIVGGSSSQKSIEIYDPIENFWREIESETNFNRYNHGAAELPNGNVLIIGGSDLSDGRYTEIFNISSETSTTNNVKLPVYTSYSPMFSLDNGNPVIFSIGDIVSTNQKSFQEYNLSNNSWQSSNNVGVGVSGYTVHRLNNGKFFLIGGNSTSGNGSSFKTYLIDQKDRPSCSEPILTNNIQTTSECFGKEGKISISSSQSGVKYSLWRDQVKLSSDYNGNGSTLEIPINSDELTEGETFYQIGANKIGCPTMMLSNSALLNFNLTITEEPTIKYVSGDTISCTPDEVVISANNPTSNIVWHNNATGPSAMFNQFTEITARYESNGCLSEVSNSISTRKIQGEDLDVSNNPIEVCSSDTFQLKGFPKGGYWTGNGIFNDSMYTSPIHTRLVGLKYNYCNTYAQKYINIQEAKSINFDYEEGLKYYPDPTVELCGSQKRTVTFNDILLVDDKYSVYFNDSIVGQGKEYSYDGMRVVVDNDSSGTVKVVIESDYNEVNNLCPIDSFVKIFDAPALKRPRSDYEILYPEIYCQDQTAKIYLLNPDTNTFFSINRHGKVLDHNADTVTFEVPSTSWGSFAIDVTNSATCSSSIELVDDVILFKNLSMRISNLSTVKVGDTLQLDNGSAADYYEWDIDGDYRTEENIDTVINEAGVYEIRLIGYLDAGCSDTTYTTVHVIEEYAPSPITSCYWDTLNLGISQLENQKIHIDKQGNKYVYGAKYINRQGANYSGSYGWVLAKFNSNWELQWVNRTDTISRGHFSHFYSTFINSIDTDEEGNVYVAGSFKTRDFEFENFNIKRNLSDYELYQAPFMGKINPQGTFDWFYYNELNEEELRYGGNSRAGTDVLFKNGKAYYSITGLGRGYYTSTTGDSLPIPLNNPGFFGSLYNGVVELDVYGNYINTYRTTSAMTSPFPRNPSSSSIVTGRLQYDIPELVLTDDNTITCKGVYEWVYDSSEDFNGHVLESSSKRNDYFGYSVDIDISKGEMKEGAHILNDLPYGNWVYGPAKVAYQFSNFTSGSKSTAYEFEDGESFSLHRKPYNFETCIVSSMNYDGSFNWKKEISGFEAQKISYDFSNDRIVISGRYKFGLQCDGKGYDYNEREDIAILIFDGDGNQVFSDNVSANGIILYTSGHYLTSCGDLIIPMEGGGLRHGSDSLIQTGWNTVVLEIPFGSQACNTECSIITSNSENDIDETHSIFPNPSNNFIFIQGQTSNVVSTQVMDLNGRVILNKVNPENGINISKLSSGIYVLKMINKDGSQEVVKFEKMK